MKKLNPQDSLAGVSFLNWIYVGAIGIGTSMIAFAYFKGPIKDLVAGIGVFENSVELVLWIATTFVLANWLLSPWKNIRIIKDWLPYATEQRNEQYELYYSIGIVITFGGLFYFLNDIFAYSVVFSIYCVIYWFSIRHFHRWVESAIKVAREEINSEMQIDAEQTKLYLLVINALEKYHLKKKHLLRIASMLVCGIISVILLIVFHDSMSQVLQLSVSVFLSLVLLVAEFAIIGWRNERNQAIALAGAKLQRLK